MSLKRILFVDDEPNILEGLRDLLRKYRRQMEMVFAGSGEAALEELRQASFDAIVSDMRMPGMDGAALLRRVKEEYPDIIRIILSGHADRDAIFMALPVSHQFLAKPCDAETLRHVIERSCRLRDVLADEALRKQIGGIDKLPSLPQAYHELIDAMSHRKVSTAMIADIIERDSAMSAKLLQLVNSACFGAKKSIAKIDHAVTYLGMDLVRTLALTVHVFTGLAEGSQGESFEAIQEHAIRVARIAKRLLPQEQESQQAFTAALLHEVGRIILAVGAADRYANVIETAVSQSRPLHDVEAEVLGVTHATAGAYLLGLWGLPVPIVEAVAYHHTPQCLEGETLDVASATMIADLLADSLTKDAPLPEHLHILPHWIELAREELAMDFAHLSV